LHRWHAAQPGSGLLLGRRLKQSTQNLDYFLGGLPYQSCAGKNDQSSLLNSSMAQAEKL